MVDLERRRRRPAVSCTLCRQRKIRCNREIPCSNCIRTKKEPCIYSTDSHFAPLPLRKTTERPRPSGFDHGGYSITNSMLQESTTASPSVVASSHPPCSPIARSLLANSPNCSLPSDHTPGQNVEATHRETTQPEEARSLATSGLRKHSGRCLGLFSTKTVSYLANSHTVHESRLFGSSQVLSRGMMHKSRLFGHSHWSSGIADMAYDIVEMIEQQDRTGASKLFEGLERCKSLGRMIKRQRTPQWPTLAVSHLPSKDISDTLAECYLRTIENVYRVLHVPTFRRDYEAIWTLGSKADTSFMIQLKLVLAIGATVYDEKFYMRSSALQWVYEAQTWIAEPEFKARLSLHYLQTSILLLLAREATSVGEDFTWIDVGALVRAAVYMGLHRDPVHLPKRTLFGAEMRRRLWNTILEMSLHSSLLCGGPPLMSLDTFDSEPPGNFDDEQLLTENPIPKPEHEFSHMTTARALRRTWEMRLRIAEYLNDLTSHGTYDEALQLDHDFRALYKELSHTIHSANFKGKCSPSYFAINYVDFVMRRWLMSVHVPFLGPNFHATTYAFSHKVVIDASLKLWKITYPGETTATSQAEDDEIIQARRDLTRLTICGNGYLRTCTFQASFLVAGELLNQLREDEGLGPVTLRPDLLAVLHESKDWSLRCLEAGETNIKGYLLNCLLATYVDGLMRGMDKPALCELLFKTAEEAEAKCSIILELAALQDQTRPDDPRLSSPDSLVDPMGEWDYMISDDQFNFTNDSMNWLFNDEPALPIF